MINICSQVVGSGKTSVLINNKPKPEVKKSEPPVIVESAMIKKSDTEPEIMIGGGKYYALIIGISNYDDPQINQLDRPVKDAEVIL